MDWRIMRFQLEHAIHDTAISTARRPMGTGVQRQLLGRHAPAMTTITWRYCVSSTSGQVLILMAGNESGNGTPDPFFELESIL